MVQLETRIPEIVNRLRSLDPEWVYLFGSVASGDPDEARDLDIAVVLNPDSEPASFEERLALQVAVRRAIYELSEQIPIDLIVYTRQQFEALKSRDRPFIREVLRGKLLYEKPR